MSALSFFSINGASVNPFELATRSDWIYEDTEIPEDQRPALWSVISKTIGLIKDLFYVISTLFSRITHRNNYVTNKIPEDNVNSGGLCVLLHGLNGHPSSMDCVRDELEEKLEKPVTFYQPFVEKRGNCSIEDSSDKIYKLVVEWGEKNPEKPIIFCGVSNGARMSAYIATKLKTDPSLANPIKVNSIAGPFFGSKMVNQPDLSERGQSIWKWLMRNPMRYSKAIFDELSWGNEKAKKIIDDMRPVANEKMMSFDFYGTWGDSKVTSFTSSLPRDINGGSYYVFKYEGHSSIVKASRAQIAIKTKEFMRTNQGES
jgi:hypothetical protein